MLSARPKYKDGHPDNRAEGLFAVERYASILPPAHHAAEHQLKFIHPVEEPRGEEQVEWYEKANADDEWVKGEGGAAHHIPRLVCEKIGDAAAFHGNLGDSGEKIAQSVYHADSGGDAKSNPHQPIAEKSAGSFGQFQRQLNYWVGQALLFRPLPAQQSVDTQHNKDERKSERAPPKQRSRPDFEIF